MPSEPIKKTLIILFLAFLTASAFLIRLSNFKSSPNRSIDEIVYYRMAKQILHEGLSGYNTIPYARDLTAHDRPLPRYFFEPLFKHPPLFTFLLLIPLVYPGNAFHAVFIVPILFGVAMIPLTYLLGSMIYNRTVGFLAAFLLWFDPVNIICSQKIWMDTTLAFFILLSVYFFGVAVKHEKNLFFILGGISCGLATLTKYVGILAVIGLVVYAWIYRKDLFKKKQFYLACFLPIILLLPWVAWNFAVYGSHFLNIQTKVHPELLTRLTIKNLIFFGGFLAAVALIIKSQMQRSGLSATQGTKISRRGKVLLGGLLILGIGPELIRSFYPFYFPFTSWSSSFNYDRDMFFYFGRLVEFSPIYIISFIALFTYEYHREDKDSFLRIFALVILFFFVMWKNYQSRYILAAIPLLMMLAASFIYEVLSKDDNRWAWRLGRTILVIFLIYTFFKTAIINNLVSFPHDFCYF